jgi:hypothetical protein
VGPRGRSAHGRSCSGAFAGDDAPAQRWAFEVDAMGAMDDAVENGVGQGGIAEQDVTPQYRNDCQQWFGSSMSPIRSTVSSLRSAQAGRVAGLAGSECCFETADIAGSRRKQRISKRRLVRCGRIVISRECRCAPCSP